VFTPKWVVDEILDLVGYTGDNILGKNIMEPASGDGIFLITMVERYIDVALKAKHKPGQIKMELEKHIYGIELDSVEYTKSIKNLNKLVSLKLDNKIIVNWKIYNDDTLFKYKEYISFFDFVVGNPPYIRIHNLDLEVRKYLKKEFNFTEGTIDMYISFFELGFKILKKDGKLGFITPNSFLHNSSYKRFREYLINTKALKTLIDFKSNKIFNGFSAYTAISIIQFNTDDNNFRYKELVNNKIKDISTISYKNIKANNWSFANKEDTAFISSIESDNGLAIQNFFNVQYGFATLRDKIFIGTCREKNKSTVYFNDTLIEKNILRKIVKGSTYRGKSESIKYIIFPYIKKDDRYIPFCENDIKKDYPLAYKYLLGYKDELLKRDFDKGINWYEFGRSQGIQSMHGEKIVCSTLMKDEVVFYKLPADTMVYSGIFIVKKRAEVSWNELLKTLGSNDFKRFIKITGKDFSGGYKSITSNQIKQFKLIK